MKKTWAYVLTIIIIGCISLFSISGCHGFFAIAEASSIRFQGPLRVAIHQDLILRSIEKDLISTFSKSIGIKLQLIPFSEIENAENWLNNEKVDLVFTRTKTKSEQFSGHHFFVYDDLRLSVTCSSGLDNAATVYVPEHYEHVLKNLSFKKIFRQKTIKTGNFTLSGTRPSMIEQKGLCLVSDKWIALQSAQHYPQLQVVWTSNKADSISWVTRKDLTELNQIIHGWYQGLARTKQLKKFWDRYQSVEFKMTLLEHRRFQKDITKKLPRWKRLFEKYSATNQMPWTLLAAVAYQESKWMESATSHTGVKGLMQLTKTTAKHLGVTDRENPTESVRGGATYLKYLFDKTSSELSSYERWAQALSAYNMGWAHLRDARRLAKKLGKDPNRWSQFKTILPLLGKKEYLEFLSFGPARGDETVNFVEQVFGYTDLLKSTYSASLIRRSPTSLDF